jgi:hypothetical protein
MQSKATLIEETHVESYEESDRGQNDDDYERRYQMALEDIRREKERNAELQEQITKLRSSSTKPQETGWLDWETEKQRIVAALEADSFGATEAKQTERLGIEEVLRMTDEVIATKDREIRELKRVLQEKDRELVKNVANKTDAVTTKEVVDADDVIREERERLQAIQKEWRDKLRQAEVDISLERAKIARERADLDEQVRLVKDTLLSTQGTTEAGGERSPRGRWLAQLGLTPADREPSRRH